jgi:hypothetical protein
MRYESENATTAIMRLHSFIFALLTSCLLDLATASQLARRANPFVHVGCYPERSGGKILSVARGRSKVLTVAMCETACSAYLMYGLENGKDVRTVSAIGSWSTNILSVLLRKRGTIWEYSRYEQRLLPRLWWESVSKLWWKDQSQLVLSQTTPHLSCGAAMKRMRTATHHSWIRHPVPLAHHYRVSFEERQLTELSHQHVRDIGMVSNAVCQSFNHGCWDNVFMLTLTIGRERSEVYGYRILR